MSPQILEDPVFLEFLDMTTLKGIREIEGPAPTLSPLGCFR
jgi:hypothetical protein